MLWTRCFPKCRLHPKCSYKPLTSKTHFRDVCERHSSTRSHPLPVIDACPSPSCACRETPQGLDIDQKLPLNNTIPRYSEQLIISTGKDDWKSRIEDEEDNVLARELKNLIGRGGKYTDPSFNVAIANSSFLPSPSSLPRSTSAFAFPSFRYIPTIPTDPGSVENFLKAFLLPERPVHDTLPSKDVFGPIRSEAAQYDFRNVSPVSDIVILICGHGGRDQRCGVLGPILRDEFLEQLSRQGVGVQTGPPEVERNGASPTGKSARVGLISHIGGHKFAGNVIIYTPPNLAHHSLAGTGIWYGRIEPQHVEGLVKETILGGRVIKEKFRGGISRIEGMLTL